MSTVSSDSLESESLGDIWRIEIEKIVECGPKNLLGISSEILTKVPRKKLPPGWVVR
jgi:hypothetical protein